MKSEIPNTSVELVRFYLNAMQHREIEIAVECLHPDFEMIFPGGVVFNEIAQLIEWAKPRYQSVGKRVEHYELSRTDSGLDVVWCFGTLYGKWPCGEAFEGIRFVDRFTVLRGRLLDQQVWNDLAEESSRK